MTKKIGNLSFSVKNQTLFIKEYCEHQKGMVIDFGAFPIQCLGVCAVNEGVVVTIPNSGSTENYHFQSNSEHNARTFVNKLSNEVERILLSKSENTKQHEPLRIEDK